jgi:hypothetical protein
MNDRLRELVEALKREHHECEDGWFSCPKSPEGCINEDQEGCTCGADTHNARVDALLAALDAEPDGWQPIETAPKDGTEVDLWTAEGRRANCKWRAGEWVEIGLDWSDNLTWLPVGCPPTHWTPIPAPPEVKP